MTKQDLYDYLRQHDHAVLATVTPFQEPQAALIGYAITPELELVFDTSQQSRKYPNIRLNDRVALVIGWGPDITVQYEGEAWEPAATALARYKEQYFARFPAGREREAWPDIAYLVVSPRWVRYSDFGEASPTIVEWQWDA